MKCYDNELYLYSQNTIRECRGLSLLISLLSHDNNAVNIKAAQVLSNLAMNEENQQTLKVLSSNKFIALVPRAVILFGQYQNFKWEMHRNFTKRVMYNKVFLLCIEE